MEPVTLRTPRLVLSIPTAADLDAIYDGCQDADVQRYTTVPSPYLREDAEAYLQRVAEGWAEATGLVWAIRADGAFAGAVGLHRISEGNAELGYWLAPPFRGRGLVAEAARAVLDFGFASLAPKLVRVEWHAVVGNIASARTGRALGFRYEGTLRQSLSNSLGRTDAWVAGLLSTDDRTPQPWPVLPD
jgi:RimJ/RimL family protein N-acetyltransferase